MNDVIALNQSEISTVSGGCLVSPAIVVPMERRPKASYAFLALLGVGVLVAPAATVVAFTVCYLSIKRRVS